MFRYFLSLALLLALPCSAWAQLYDVVVAQDGSGQFTSIQEAVNSIRDYKPEGRQRILVRNGVYEEKVIIPSYKTNITLVGESRDSTILVWHDHANIYTVSGFGADRRLTPRGEGRKIGTFQSYTLRVDGPGFECENMTIANDAMTHHNPNWHNDHGNKAGVGQAVSVHVEGDRCVFRNCRLLGFQDTVFNGNEDSRQLFYRCYIEGTVDFIFGPATCWFEQCELHALSQGYFTAASTPAHHPFGYVFNRCRLTAAPGVSGEWLGRPWRNWAAVLFKDCEMADCIHPQGWNNWRDPIRETTARYAEVGCTGPGADRSGRVAWSRTLTPAEAEAVTIERVFSRVGDTWRTSTFPVDFRQVVQTVAGDVVAGHGAPYLAGTLGRPAISAPDNASSGASTGAAAASAEAESLVVRFDSVDCTTFVEYVSAALLGRVAQPTPSDSILRRFVQALRYHDGVRGGYATRCHYFSDWTNNGVRQGLMTDVTAQLPGAKPLNQCINYMSQHPLLYPALADPSALEGVRSVERALSQAGAYYLPVSAIQRACPQLQEGDIVAFVTSEAGLDIQHVGFVWLDAQGQPTLLHASSREGRVAIYPRTLADYARGSRRCVGIRIIRLNRD